MAQCDVCGNDYDKAFTIIRGDNSYTFDCFECAIHALAPLCDHCNCRIIGHGMEADGQFFCCANCAKQSGQTRMRDRADEQPAL